MAGPQPPQSKFATRWGFDAPSLPNRKSLEVPQLDGIWSKCYILKESVKMPLDLLVLLLELLLLLLLFSQLL